MARHTTGRAVLMSIHPAYAEAILRGDKKVEFRKRAFRSPVAFVVIYATAPIRKVVGYFHVDEVDKASPAALWRRYSPIGGIDKAHFDHYFRGDKSGAGIRVGRTVRFPRALPLETFLRGRPPQSFQYLDDWSPKVSRR